MPFITEELWDSLGFKGKPLILSDWDFNLPEGEDQGLSLNTDRLIEIISSIRSIRSELNIPAKANLSLEIMDKNYKELSKIENINMFLKKLVRSHLLVLFFLYFLYPLLSKNYFQ